MTEERTGSGSSSEPSAEQPESPDVQPAPGAPAAPSAPAEPAEATEPAGAAEPTAAESAESAESTEPADSTEPAEPGEPATEPIAAAPAAGLPRWRVLAIAAGSVAGVAILAVVAVLVIGGLTGDDDVPTVGECLTHSADPAEMEVVDCDSADAAWEVIGNDGSWTEQAFAEASREEVCQPFRGWENALWLGERTEDLSGDGEVVCLAPTDPEASTE